MANERARQLRRDSTEPERRLWRELSGRRLGGRRFRRQHPIGSYIVDFVCLVKRFVVEVDGVHHDEPDRAAHDQHRTQWLEGEGFTILRVRNGEILDNLSGVAETIFQEIGLRPDVAPSRRAVRPPPPSRAK
jgi:5-methyltetrahydrofolate--homocysteine methyltransferase